MLARQNQRSCRQEAELSCWATVTKLVCVQLLHALATWPPHAALLCAVQQSIDTSSPYQRTDRRTDGRTPDRCRDLASHGNKSADCRPFEFFKSFQYVNTEATRLDVDWFLRVPHSARTADIRSDPEPLSLRTNSSELNYSRPALN